MVPETWIQRFNMASDFPQKVFWDGWLIGGLPLDTVNF